MKRCPQCGLDYTDDTLSFCREDGALLLDGQSSSDESPTEILSSTPNTAESATMLFKDRPSGVVDNSRSSDNSIAVLPFSNISADPENDYFCDGLAEDLINALSSIKGLKVAARTSSFSFRGMDARVENIGRSLGVQSVLEGSVRKAGKRLRVQIQLVDTENGFHIWSAKYDRDLMDVFEVQDDISLSVVNALKVEFLGDERSRVLKRNTEDPEVYQLLLRARHQFRKLTSEGFEKSIELFRSVLEAEPDSASALAGLGLTYGTMVVFGAMPPSIGLPQTFEFVDRAIEIDKDLVEAQFALAMANAQNARDWEAAERAFIRTIELNPGHASARAQYGVFLASFERFDEALHHAEQAISLDPIGLSTLLDVGVIFWILKDYKRVRDHGNALRELDANFPGGFLLEGVAAWEENDLESAISKMERASSLGLPYGVALSACLNGVAGKRRIAEELLEELLDPEPGQYVFASQLAIIYSGLGDLDSTFECLDRAMEQMETIPFKSLLRQLPGVAGDPRFANLLERVGLPFSV